MSNRQAKVLSAAVLAAGIAFSTAPAQAQYLARHYYYRTAPILHPNARAFYNAQAYAGGAINVLPVTTVLPLIDGLYDPYDDYHSAYGCCGSTRNNERLGLVGNNQER
jgi:hypothetical protein